MGQLPKTLPGKRQRIYVVIRDRLPPIIFCVPPDKLHIKRVYVMSHQDHAADEFIELRQRIPEHRRILHHAVVDVIDLRRIERNRAFGVDQSREFILDPALLHLDRRDLYDCVAVRIRPGRLQVEDYIIRRVFIKLSSSFFSKHSYFSFITIFPQCSYASYLILPVYCGSSPSLPRNFSAYRRSLICWIASLANSTHPTQK